MSRFQVLRQRPHVKVLSALAVVATLSMLSPAAFGSVGSPSVGAFRAGSARSSLASPPNIQSGRASGPFGAIYANARTGGGGKSWGWPTKRGAEREASRECRIYNGAGCQGVIWVGGAECGAVGFNPSRTKIYYAFAPYSERTAKYEIRAKWPRARILTGVCGTHR